MSRRKKKIYKFKKGAREAYRGFSYSLMMFILLVTFSIFFILNQYKKFQINFLEKENQTIRVEIENLRVVNSRLKSKIDNQLASYSRISTEAKKMGLVESLEKPEAIIVSSKKQKNYEEKDKKAVQ
jgi:cell division protein FtsL